MTRLRALCALLLLPLAMAAQTPDWNAARDETLQHLQRMIRINTSNPPGNELPVAQFLDSVLKASGIESHLFEPTPGRATNAARPERKCCPRSRCSTP